MRFRLRLAVLAGMSALLSGCSGVGWLPSQGAHSLSAARLDALVQSYGKANGVPPALVHAVIDAESHGDPSAISRAGAQGLMQLMPGTQLTYGVGNPFDPSSNINGGTRFLHDLLVRYHNNVPLALAAYNAGPGAVEQYHGIPPYAETRAYVARVTAELRSF